MGRRSGSVQLLAVAALALALAQPAWAQESAAGAGLKPGDVLNQATAQKAEGLLPPEILKHYQTGEYANPIVDWPSDKFAWPVDFRAATEKNAGQLDVDPTGTIIEKGSGKQPPYILGFPFPIIDPADPKAGAKVVWNYFYRTWYFGTLYAESQLNWIGPHALERRTDVDASFEYYDGVPERERPANPDNFSARLLTVVISPADLNGTAALTWRFRDPLKRDMSWAYVPALRRVRAVSPANRSDGFLGSDMDQDDGPFFDGKPEDFTWSLKGEADQLRLVDPLSIKGQSDQVWLPKGGWQGNWPDLKFLGYMDADWKGIAWAPLTGALAKRRFWIVDGIPKDKYYLYGRLEFYIDKETFQGAWNRKFGWQGELLNTMQVMAFWPKAFTRPDGTVDYNQGSNMAFQCAEDIKRNRATVAGIKSSPKSGFEGRLPFDANRFDVNSLSHFGK
ncbi:MAG: DUF1329 domain-containing protein [Candidatus Binatia bacterium]